jgi:transposase
MAKSRSGVTRPDVDGLGNVVGIDPHKRTLTATVADRRGGIVASEHFRVSGDGHRALEAWALQFGPVVRWGIEGASSWGRHTAVFLIGRGHEGAASLTALARERG